MTGSELLRTHLAELTKEVDVQGDVIEEGIRLYVLLHKLPLPEGLFQLDESDVLFMTDQQYPLSAMDMFLTEVGVVRPDGSIPQNAESIEAYIGREWRRFSWHRNEAWNSTGNPLLHHYAFMEARWHAERQQRQAA
jgi:hypothetical protein